jgi:hypothetical protein
LLHSFPGKDRGEFNMDDEQAGMIKVIEDPLEAAALKAKLKQ